jgi:hypothetical protein
VTLLIRIAVLPAFVAVTFLGALFVPTLRLPKLRLAGETFRAVALPVRSTNCGFDDALSTISIDPVDVPADLGLNSELIEQFSPAANVLPQVVLIWNWPDTLIEVIERVAAPSLVSDTVCCGLDVLINCTGKASGAVVGEKLTTPVLSIVVV